MPARNEPGIDEVPESPYPVFEVIEGRRLVIGLRRHPTKLPINVDKSSNLFRTESVNLKWVGALWPKVTWTPKYSFIY